MQQCVQPDLIWGKPAGNILAGPALFRLGMDPRSLAPSQLHGVEEMLRQVAQFQAHQAQLQRPAARRVAAESPFNGRARDAQIPSASADAPMPAAGGGSLSTAGDGRTGSDDSSIEAIGATCREIPDQGSPMEEHSTGLAARGKARKLHRQGPLLCLDRSREMHILPVKPAAGGSVACAKSAC